MANILTIEVGAVEIRVAEMKDEKKGSSIRRCFRFPVSQGLVEDGLIQDVQGLGEQLKNELLANFCKKGSFYRGIEPDCQQRDSYSLY